MLPMTTRLRYVKAKDPLTLVKFCDNLSKRIEIKDIVYSSPYWFLWFVPDDKSSDVRSGEIVIASSKGKEAIGYVKN